MSFRQSQPQHAWITLGRMRARYVSMFACGAALALLFAARPAPVMATPALPPDAPPWLGVLIGNGARGVLILNVIPGTPADQAGIVADDEILAIAETLVSTPAELQTAIARHRVTDAVELRVWSGRGNQIRTVTVILGPRLDDSEILYRRLVGKSAPDFDLPAITGAEVGSLHALRGRVVMLQFFSTQCAECIAMHRRLSRLVDARARDGLVILAVSSEDSDVLESWAVRAAPSFTVLHDSFGLLTRQYHVTREPALVVIDRYGNVGYAGIGAASLERAIFAAERALGSRRVR